MDLPASFRDQIDFLGILDGNSPFAVLSDQEIRQALTHPIWPNDCSTTSLNLVQPSETVCIIISDHTRTTATDRILPIILDALLNNGCSSQDISLLIASGIHKHPTHDEIISIIGEESASILGDHIFLHDPDDHNQLANVGSINGGVPVHVNRRAVEADRLILIGAATYHYHAGFSGGRKSLVPGIASRATIAYNHSLTLHPTENQLHPGAAPGILDGNPVAESMLQAARLCKPDIIVNSVLNPEGLLIGVFSGELDLAHREACRTVEKIYRVDISRPADIVIASAGKAPNWIQSHKALFNAMRATQKDGYVILIAPAPRGLGDDRFRHWIKKSSTDNIFRCLRKSPEVLGQTALSTKEKASRTILITNMPESDTTDLGITLAADIECALQTVCTTLTKQAGQRPSCYIMPHARYTVPFHADVQYQSGTAPKGSGPCADR